MNPSFLLAFPLLLALSTPCSACMCKILHPQTFYCMSDIVAVADIIGQGRDTFLKRNYRVRVTEILKAPEEVTKIDRVYTPKNWDRCGYEVRTTEQSQLLMAGYLRKGSLHFTRCHLIYFWNRLTREQKLGFRAGYERGCKCTVQPCLFCWRDCPQPDVTDCVWQQRGCDYQIWEGNHSLYSMCAPTPSGQCEWTRINVSTYQPQITTPETTTMTPSVE